MLYINAGIPRVIEVLALESARSILLSAYSNYVGTDKTIMSQMHNIYSNQHQQQYIIKAFQS